MLKERLHHLYGETFVIVLFDKLVEGGTKGLEHQTKMTSVVEGVLVLYNALLVLLVSSIDVLDDLLFYPCRLHVLGNRPNYLHHEYSTFIA